MAPNQTSGSQLNPGASIVALTAKNGQPIATHQCRADPVPGNGIVDTLGEFGTVVSTRTSASNTAMPGSVTHDLTELIIVQHRDKQLALPASMFRPSNTTSFSIPFAFSDLIANGGKVGNLHIPLLQEEMSVEKKVVDTGRGLRIKKQVIETPHVVEHPLQRDNLVVKHVPRNHLIDEGEVPATRYEGTTMIIPIIEEVLVMHTRLRLKEEIHITRESQTVIAKETVLLKTGRVQVERFDESNDLQDRRHAKDIAGTESGR